MGLPFNNGLHKNTKVTTIGMVLNIPWALYDQLNGLSCEITENKATVDYEFTPASNACQRL